LRRQIRVRHDACSIAHDRSVEGLRKDLRKGTGFAVDDEEGRAFNMKRKMIKSPHGCDRRRPTRFGTNMTVRLHGSPCTSFKSARVRSVARCYVLLLNPRPRSTGPGLIAALDRNRAHLLVDSASTNRPASRTERTGEVCYRFTTFKSHPWTSVHPVSLVMPYDLSFVVMYYAILNNASTFILLEMPIYSAFFAVIAV
jgi:hypothetical protein